MSAGALPDGLALDAGTGVISGTPAGPVGVADFTISVQDSSAPPQDGVFSPPIDFPPHERCVDIAVDLGLGAASATVLGADLTHEYVSENADYRS